MFMSTGQSSGYRRAHEILYDLHSCKSWKELEQFTLGPLHGLIRSERSSWTEFRDQQNVGYYEWSADHLHLKAEYYPIITKYLGIQHPVVAELSLKRRWPRAYRISDLMSRRAFEKTELYNEGYLPTGVRYQITLQVHVSDFGLTTVSFSRLKSAFTDAERETLDSLMPHFRLVTGRLLREQRLLEAYREILPAVCDHHPCIAFDREYYLYDANAKGEHLLQSLPDFDGRRLPAVLIQSIEQHGQGNTTLNTHAILAKQCYLIRGAPSDNPHFRYISLEKQDAAQIIAQRGDRIGLTTREVEIAFWVKQGKSNKEIATILGISPRTVGKHVENIFTKLHLENRYALLTAR
jgi:DNA-binding CsgD family transcriptional regulator